MEIPGGQPRSPSEPMTASREAISRARGVTIRVVKRSFWSEPERGEAFIVCMDVQTACIMLERSCMRPFTCFRLQASLLRDGSG